MPRSVRSTLSAVLLVLACLLVPLGALSTWSRYEIGDADNYVATMAPLASDPAVRSAVADAVTGAVMEEIDVGPLQGAVESFVRDAAGSFTETAAYKTAWNAANRAAHDAVQRALSDDSDGAVTIDLAPITQRIKQQLSDDGVPFASKIPVEHTEVTVMRSKDLGWLRQVIQLLQSAGLWLPVAAAVSAVGGVLAAGRRRRAVVVAGLGIALAAGLLLGAVAVGRALTLSDLPPDISRGAVGSVYDALTESLWVAGWVVLGAGTLLALGAWLAPRVRRAAAPRAVPRAPTPLRP